MNHSSTASTDQAPDALTVDPATLVRRAILASARELDAALVGAAPADRRRHKALDRWFAGFAAQVRNHHELVDTLVVPTLAARRALDDRSLDIIADDHSYIDELVSQLGDALGVLSFGLGAEAFWIGKASDLAGALAHVLAGQLAREEQMLTPLVERCLSADEPRPSRSRRCGPSPPDRCASPWPGSTPTSPPTSAPPSRPTCRSAAGWCGAPVAAPTSARRSPPSADQVPPDPFPPGSVEVQVGPAQCVGRAPPGHQATRSRPSWHPLGTLSGDVVAHAVRIRVQGAAGRLRRAPRR